MSRAVGRLLRFARLFLLFAPVYLPMSSSARLPSFAEHLESLRWDRRVVLLTASVAPGPEGVREQLPAWREYQLAVYAVEGEAVTPIHPARPGLRFALSPEVRQRWFPDETEASLLIGFDGGIKERQRGAVKWETYYAAIEQMPMRRAERRERTE